MSSPSNECKMPPEIPITSIPNGQWGEHISENSDCLNSIDSSDSDSNILESCISPLISSISLPSMNSISLPSLPLMSSPVEGFDTQGETPDCPAIDNQYDAAQYGPDKKYYWEESIMNSWLCELEKIL